MWKEAFDSNAPHYPRRSLFTPPRERRSAFLQRRPTNCNAPSPARVVPAMQQQPGRVPPWGDTRGAGFIGRHPFGYAVGFSPGTGSPEVVVAA
jgi:hypothetical protein